jgi:hypothetical protein
MLDKARTNRAFVIPYAGAAPPLRNILGMADLTSLWKDIELHTVKLGGLIKQVNKPGRKYPRTATRDHL